MVAQVPPSLSVPTSLLAIMHFGVFLVPFLIFIFIILKPVPRILALQLLLCSFPLHKICENTGFQWHIFSRISTKSTILSLYGRIRVSENPYSRIFYAVFSYGISCVQKSRNFSLTSWENGWNLWSQFLFFQVKSIKISTWSKHGLTLATMLVIVI